MRIAMKLLPAFVLGFAASLAQGQEIVTLQTRPGVTQSYFLTRVPGDPQAVAVLFPGGAVPSACARKTAAPASARTTFW